MQLGMLPTAWQQCDVQGLAHCSHLTEAVAIAEQEHLQLHATSHEQEHQQEEQQQQEEVAHERQLPEQQQQESSDSRQCVTQEPVLLDVVTPGCSVLLEDSPLLLTDELVHDCLLSSWEEM